MPRQEAGPIKFGVEHDVRSQEDKNSLSAKKVREQAAHYEDSSDKQ